MEPRPFCLPRRNRPMQRAMNENDAAYGIVIVRWWRTVQNGDEKIMEMRGIDPRASHMLSERSTIWATPPIIVM